MEKYGISWKKLDTHKPHLSVLDYKKQERSREVKELEQELEDIGVVIELKEEREARLNREINKQELQLKKNREEAEKTLSIIDYLKEKALDEGKEQEKRNKYLIADNQELEDVITDKKEQLADLQAALARAHTVFDKADEELNRTREELAEVRKLRSELIAQVDGDYYLKEEVIIGNLIEKLEIRPEVYVVDKLENMVLNKFVKEQVMLLKETPNKSLDNPGDYQFLKDDEAVYQVDESNQPIRIQFKEGKGEELFNMLNSFGLEGNLIEPFKRVEEALRLICKGDL
jgi:DNA repair exonuclease SbcCD ATPase subunit